MARARLLGYMQCPECGFPDAEIRQDKSGHAYRHCADGCGANYFSHCRERDELLRQKIRPGSAPGSTAIPSEAAPPSPPPADVAAGQGPAPARRKGSTFLDLLGGE